MIYYFGSITTRCLIWFLKQNQLRTTALLPFMWFWKSQNVPKCFPYDKVPYVEISSRKPNAIFTQKTKNKKTHINLTCTYMLNMCSLFTCKIHVLHKICINSYMWKTRLTVIHSLLGWQACVLLMCGLVRWSTECPHLPQIYSLSPSAESPLTSLVYSS